MLVDLNLARELSIVLCAFVLGAILCRDLEMTKLREALNDLKQAVSDHLAADAADKAANSFSASDVADITALTAKLAPAKTPAPAAPTS